MGAYLVILLCLGLLYLWSHHHAQEHKAKILERQERCPHPPEAQQTIRVNSILTMNPNLLHAVLPGRRWLVKHCRACNKQRMMYRPTLQPWDEFKAEYDQETLDRQAQYEARKAAHKADEANKERLRLIKREQGMKKHG